MIRDMSRNDAIRLITDNFMKLTNGEQVVANYIIGNMQHAIRMSIDELEERTGMSRATIIRFCHTLGFSGYRSFKISMAELTSPFDDHVLSLDYIKGDVEVEVKKIASAEMMTIQQTVDSIDYEILNKAADMILSSKNILFHGAGTSSIVCVDAMLRFLRIGLSVCSYNDIHFAIVPLSYYNDSDLVIGISHSGETKDTCNLMRMARAQNVKTIGITTYPSQEISKYCDLILKTITRESPNHKVAITSRTSQQIIIDALFIAVAIRSKQIPTNGLMNVSKNVNEYLY